MNLWKVRPKPQLLAACSNAFGRFARLKPQLPAACSNVVGPFSRPKPQLPAACSDAFRRFARLKPQLPAACSNAFGRFARPNPQQLAACSNAFRRFARLKPQLPAACSDAFGRFARLKPQLPAACSNAFRRFARLKPQLPAACSDAFGRFSRLKPQLPAACSNVVGPFSRPRLSLQNLLFFALLAATVFSLGSCAPATALPDPGPAGSRTPSPMLVVAAASPSPEPQASPAALLPTHEAEPTAPVQADASPLRFNFPTPAPAPVSKWRPPLYEVPWALGSFDHFYFTRPIAADEVNWPLPSYRYGALWPDREDIIHTGIDIDAPRGTPILAAGPGKVIGAGYGLFYGSNDPTDPYGLAVSILHDFGYRGRRLYTIYAHMDRIDVVIGQRVESGTPLGILGNTGLTTGPHLHFEVRIEGNSFYATRNPELWLAPPQGWGVLVGSLKNSNGSILTGQGVTVKSLDSGQKWKVASYGNSLTVNSDDYYHENLVLSDLPAGDYEIFIEYDRDKFTHQLTIYPGAISYFTFRGKFGFTGALPPTPSPADLLKITNPGKN